jgi:L-rhamnose isomerase
MPLGAVWDEYCHRNSTPVGPTWLAEIKNYEADVLSRR